MPPSSPPHSPDIPSDLDRLIHPDAQAQIRMAIEAYDGDEVFFVGRVDSLGVVEEVEPCAFGNEGAVPVIEHLAQPGNVVIHNHPSGELRPSEPDIQVASRVGNSGVGSYIVDNAVTQIRIIVPCMRPKERKALDVSALEETVGPNGAIARAMDRFENRPQQADMLRTVADAFNDDGIAVVEAGTGTGKSLAYLIPAVYWAKTNGEKVLISTNTINLQEQLIGKDIPFLRKHLDLEFKAELMMGRNNYLCRRKSDYLRATPDFFADDATAPGIDAGGQMQAILEWAAETKTGLRGELTFVPFQDVWEQVACDGDNCTRAKCRHYATCYFYQARRRAAAADLIVANHHLVMADLAVRLESRNYLGVAVLPPYRRIIFDEAHNVEDVATQHFGIRITRRTLDRLLSRLVHRERANVGLLPFIRNRLVLLHYQHPSDDIQKAAALVEDSLIPLRHKLMESVKALMDTCARGVTELSGEKPRPRREIKVRVVDEVTATTFWSRDMRKQIDAATDQMTELSRGLAEVHAVLMKLPEKAREEMDNPAGEIRSIATRLSEHVDRFKNFYTIGDNQCRWIEAYYPARGRTPHVRLISLPLEVQERLHDAVYTKTPTVVMTSATLTVDRQFDFFLGQVGLGQEHCDSDMGERIVRRQLDTPFDFEQQAYVGVPVDIPEPFHQGFGEAATQFLLPLLQTARGSAFVLFTSYSQLNDFHRRLAPVLEPMGYTCLKQGTENRQTLLKRFKNDRSSILFATSSFWEGVDVPGEALRLLVLVKLPFRVPTDPLLEARVERLEAMGIDSFSNYSLPHAVIRFKQGFGRLIRRRDDHGAIVVLDRRIATKRYGQVFLNSLPTGTVHCKPSLDLMDDLRGFFGNLGGNG